MAAKAVGRRRARGIAVACGLLLALASAAAAPSRVVSTNLCADEYVFRLVPRGQIAALSFEAGDRRPVVSTIADKVGGIVQIRPSVETVLNLKPDLVVVQTGATTRLEGSLRSLGVPVLDVPYDNSLADIRKTTAMLGAALGAPERARALLAQMDARLAAAHRMAPWPAVRTLIYEPNGYASAGGVTQELMALAGLRDAAPGFAVTRSGRIPVEEVIAAAPELMILSGDRRAAADRADLILHHPALAALDGRTVAAWDPLLPLLCSGPWSAEAATIFAALGRRVRR